MTTTDNIPAAFRALVRPMTKTQGGKKILTQDVETFWVPKMHAYNAMGLTNVSDEARGAPILVNRKDGEVQFTSSGRVSTKLHPEVREFGNMVLTNTLAALTEAEEFARTRYKEQFNVQMVRAMLAGQPIKDKDAQDVAVAEAERLLAIAKAQRDDETKAQEEMVAQAKAEKASKPSRQRKPKAEPVAVATNGHTDMPMPTA